MAVKKSKKKFTTIQKIVAVLGVCVVAEIVFLSLYSSEKPLPVREAIAKSVQSLEKDDMRTKEMKKLLVSLSHYASTNDGKFPTSINQLIPTYYEKAPVDPATGKPFAFEIRNSIPVILGGEDENVKQTPVTKPGEAPVNLEAEEKELIAALQNDELASDFIYDPAGKRDPFRPFDLTPKLENDDPNKTELERYTIGQLKLTAVLDSLEEPRAIVENAQGIGFTVKKGTKIGTEGGEVVEIKKDYILILEQWTDFTGEKKSRTLEMKLRGTSAE